MVRSGRETQCSVWHRPFAGLLLVLIFLGHDLFMAAQAAPALAASHANLAHHAMAVSPSGDGSASLGHHAPDPAHPDGCGVVQSAMPRAGNEPDALAGALFDRQCRGVVAPPPLATALGWNEPKWSPGSRRALLQVYRI